MRHVLALLFALPLFAATGSVSIYPIAPTSADPLTLRYQFGCFVSGETVTRSGNVIDIALDVSTPCLTTVVVRDVHLDPLPPGSYRVNVHRTNDNDVDSVWLFTVRNANKFVEAHPFAIRANVQPRPRVRITRTDHKPLCTKADCSDITLRVGGAVPNDVERADDGSVWFTSPALAPGLVDIDVISESGLTKTVGALYAFNEPDPSIFERVLFPVLLDAPGANGAHWISEAVIANPNAWIVDNYNSVEPLVCVTFPCGERLFPSTFTRFNGEGHPRGVALLTPRDEADSLSFSLRIRDTSRASEGFGTSIPVVREKDMARNHTLTLLDVPRDPRYRVKLRMYAFPPFFTQGGSIAIIDPSGGARSTQFFTYRPATDIEPAYAEIDLPAGNAGQRSAIYVQSPVESFAWAFATITNNETQQVTIVTPSGNGGVPAPCITCEP